jgi:hypothetical protein
MLMLCFLRCALWRDEVADFVIYVVYSLEINFFYKFFSHCFVHVCSVGGSALS